MNEDTIQAARAAFKQDPETACKALLGCTAEEMFITALRGCNQHAHKPGCPEAEGGGGSDSEVKDAEAHNSAILSNMQKLYEEHDKNVAALKEEHSSAVKNKTNTDSVIEKMMAETEAFRKKIKDEYEKLKPKGNYKLIYDANELYSKSLY